VALIITELLHRQQLLMGLWILLAHGAYLRPSECMNLRRKNLVPPHQGVSRAWCILVAASEAQLETKTGDSDVGVIWDAPYLSWFTEAIKFLHQGEKEGKIWDFTYLELTNMVQVVVKSLGVSFVPYQCRHSGPSWDRVKGYRTLQEIQKRGRWKASRSVNRYEKAGKLLAEYMDLPANLRTRAEQAVQELPGLVRERLKRHS